MKTIHRSIFKELIFTFLLGVLALNFVLMTERILKFTKVLASVGASLTDIGGLIILLQPQISVLTTPMALLVSILLTYGRLNTDNEIVALKASGMPLREISRPVIALGITCFAAGALLSFYVSPQCTEKLKIKVSEVIARRAPYAIEEGIFNTTFKDVVIYVKDRPSANKLSNIFIYDERIEHRPTVMYASEGSLSGSGGYEISFVLSDGHIHFVRNKTTTDLSFGRYVLTFPVSIKSPTKRYNELSPSELLAEAGKLEGEKKVKMLLEFHRRLSLPAVCLIIMFLGPPLALKAGRTGKLGGLTLGLTVFALYYTALIYTENTARAGIIPHYVGAWLPALALGAFSYIMFRKADSR
jgi:lipopolysaccharide export system permease protein